MFGKVNSGQAKYTKDYTPSVGGPSTNNSRSDMSFDDVKSQMSTTSPRRTVSYNFPFPRQPGDGSYTPPELTYADQRMIYSPVTTHTPPEPRFSTGILNHHGKRSFASIAPAGTIEYPRQPKKGEKRRQSISYYTRQPQHDPQLNQQNQEHKAHQQLLVNQQQAAHRDYVKQAAVRLHQHQLVEQHEQHMRNQQQQQQAVVQQKLERAHQKQLAAQLARIGSRSPEVIPARNNSAPFALVAPAAERVRHEPVFRVPPVDNGSDESTAETNDGDYSEVPERFTPRVNYSETHGEKKKYPCKVSGCEKSFKGRNGLKVLKTSLISVSYGERSWSWCTSTVWMRG